MQLRRLTKSSIISLPFLRFSQRPITKNFGEVMNEKAETSTRLLSIVLCERILQDVLRHDAVSCVNIYNGVTTQSFPAIIPLVYAFAQMSSSSQPFSYQYVFKDADNNVVAASPPATVEPLPNDFMTHKIISVFSGLAFEKPGIYSIQLEVEGKVVGDMPFYVAQVVQEAVV